MSMAPEQAEAAYREIEGIPGFFRRGAASLLSLLDEVQRSLDVHGDVFEIGAYSGRSARFLAHMLRPSETLGVCDAFGGDGWGERTTFERNMGPHLRRTRVHECLSSALTPGDLGDCRLIHIDGGHGKEDVLNDLTLAADALVDGGAVVVDDAFQPEWPEVTEALFGFLSTDERFKPVAVGFNKIVLVGEGGHARYLEVLGDPWGYLDRRSHEVKRARLCGVDAQVFVWRGRAPLRGRVVARARREARAGARALRAVLTR